MLQLHWLREADAHCIIPQNEKFLCLIAVLRFLRAYDFLGSQVHALEEITNPGQAGFEGAFLFLLLSLWKLLLAIGSDNVQDVRLQRSSVYCNPCLCLQQVGSITGQIKGAAHIHMCITYLCFMRIFLRVTLTFVSCTGCKRLLRSMPKKRFMCSCFHADQ